MHTNIHLDRTPELILHCTVSSNESGQSLLSLLSERFQYQEAQQWEQRIIDGQILLNDRQVPPEEVVHEGDRLTSTITDHQEPPVETEFETILETPDLLLVGKPAGTPVNRTGLIVHNTFVNILRRHYSENIHPLHRLDRETSGLLLCARNKEICCHCQPNLKNILTGKFYLAVVRGCLDQQTIAVDQPLSTRHDSPVRCRMWVTDNGKPCTTIFHVIATNDDRSLVVAELKTGRRHQIRAHLAHLGHPLIGDKIYADDSKYYLKRLDRELSDEDFRNLGARNHLLHAWSLRLKLADQPENIFFSKNYSSDLRKNLDLFPDWHRKALSVVASTPSAPEKHPKKYEA